MNISIIGLGKLGSPMAAAMAQKGHAVVGVDINSTYAEAIRNGCTPVHEPALAQLIQANRERLSATTDCEAAVSETAITFIVVPTPSEPDGTYSMRHVLRAAEKIGGALRKKGEWHLVVLTSTVTPGSTAGQLLPALEAHSGKRCGEDFGLCYKPEFIALGSAVHNLLNPDMLLIGESDTRSGDFLEGLFRTVCESNPQIQRMNYINAELAKLAVNTFVTTKISYANMLAALCERLPDADVDVVTAALGCDSRIGGKYLRGGLGYGGPCFPRDNGALSALAQANCVSASLTLATDQINRLQAGRLSELVLSRLPQSGVVAILGLSYKPDTDVIEASQGLVLARELLDRGVQVIAYDPSAMDNARKELSGKVTFAQTMQLCVAQADVVAVTTPWRDFSALRAQDLRRGATLIDCWRLFSVDEFQDNLSYIRLGRGPSTPADSRLAAVTAESNGRMAGRRRASMDARAG